MTFYLEAGVDCALGDEPIDRLSTPDLTPPTGQPPRRPEPLPSRRGSRLARPPRQRRAPRIAPPPDIAIESAREAARTAPSLEALRAIARQLRGLRAEIHRFAAGVRRRQSAGAR